MNQLLKTHTISLALVTIILVVLLVWTLQSRQAVHSKTPQQLKGILQIDGLDWDNAFDRALLHDALDMFKPGQKKANTALLKSLRDFRRRQNERLSEQAAPLPPLNGKRLFKLAAMYLRFILIYLLVMATTYYGVQTLAVWRFVLYRQRRAPYLQRLVDLIKNKPQLRHLRQRLIFLRHIVLLSAKTVLKGILYLILFAPAYVIAYSFKGNFDTSSDLFMIVLGVISNGLLIHYTNKFFTLMVAESRKGYVETALVKNLRQSFDFFTTDGLHWQDILKVRKNFSGHVLQPIYQNAAFQYLGSIKEQASFLISGLMIIEMALNIHEHLSYELLKQLLYQNYAEVILIVAGIFYLVKATEIVSDIWRKKAADSISNQD